MAQFASEEFCEPDQHHAVHEIAKNKSVEQDERHGHHRGRVNGSIGWRSEHAHTDFEGADKFVVLQQRRSATVRFIPSVNLIYVNLAFVLFVDDAFQGIILIRRGPPVYHGDHFALGKVSGNTQSRNGIADNRTSRQNICADSK